MSKTLWWRPENCKQEKVGKKLQRFTKICFFRTVLFKSFQLCKFPAFKKRILRKIPLIIWNAAHEKLGSYWVGRWIKWKRVCFRFINKKTKEYSSQVSSYLQKLFNWKATKLGPFSYFYHFLWKYLSVFVENSMFSKSDYHIMK